MIQINKYYPATSPNNSLMIRLLASGDAENLLRIFEQLSSESRYKRFLQSVDHVNKNRVNDEIDKVIAQIPEQGNGLIAFNNGEPVGAARYVRTEAQTAELAISIIDSAQGMGIGSQLMPLLTELAFEDGIVHLVGTISNSNEAMWHLINKLPYKLTRYSEGSESSFTLHLIN